MPDEIAIKVDHISKYFLLPHEKVTSIKGVVLGLAKGKAWKTKETQHALRDISFEVKNGEFFGIVGRNGSGKSTLLKILAGIYQPTKGSSATFGKVVPFIELGVGFNGELTGRENVYLNGAMLGFSRKQIDEMYNDVVAFAELERFMDQKLKNYSSGMQVRLAFSLATRAEADVLLVDEVLAVGDADFQRKCFDYFSKLKRNKKTVVFVTHDMGAVREYCDRVILIEKNQIIAEGSADKVAAKYSRMFLEEADEGNDEKESGKRWGNGAVTYDDITFEILGQGDKQKLLVTAHATAHRGVDSPNFGFLVRSAAGIAVLGTNNQIKRHFIDHMDAGQRATIRWEFDNILSDGKYFAELAIVYGGNVIADWWEDAKAIKIRKEEQMPYPVDPNIALDLRIEKSTGVKEAASK